MSMTTLVLKNSFIFHNKNTTHFFTILEISTIPVVISRTVIKCVN